MLTAMYALFKKRRKSNMWKLANGGNLQNVTVLFCKMRPKYFTITLPFFHFQMY